MDDNKIYQAELKFAESCGLRSVDGENYQRCRQDD